jgi:hypothetical protein
MVFTLIVEKGKVAQNNDSVSVIFCAVQVLFNLNWRELLGLFIERHYSGMNY